MTFSHNDLITEIYQDKNIWNYLTKIRSDLREDFKSHIMLIIAEKPFKVLADKYVKQQLDYYVLRTMMNQSRIPMKGQEGKGLSTFYIQHRRFSDNCVDFVSTDVSKEVNRKDSKDINDLEIKILEEKQLQDINHYLNHLNPISVLCFKWYYEEEMTYHEIAKHANISYSCARNNVVYIKEELKKILNT